jgi:trigger factor
LNITLDKKSNVEASIKVKLNEEDYQLKVEEKIKEHAKTASIKGFRPGKVPMGLVRKMYGKSILVEEVNHMLSHSVNDYVKEQDLKIIGQPLPNANDADKIDWDNQTEFEFEFDLGLIDEFKVELSSKQKVKGYSIKVDDKTMTETVDNLKKQFGQITNPEVSEEGDALFGILSQEGGELSNETLMNISDIDSKFQKNFIGVKKSDVVEVEIEKAIKDISTLATLLGKTEAEVQDLKGKFTFEIKNVNRTAPGEINQEMFDKVFGPNVVNSEKEFLNKISETISGNYSRETDLFLENSVRDHFIEKTKIDVPHDFLKRWLLASNDGKVTEEVLEKEYDMYVTSLKWDLIKSKIAEDNEVKVENEDVLAKSKAMIMEQFGGQGLGDQFADKIDEFADNYLKANNGENYMTVFSQVHGEKIMELIKSKVTITEKAVSVDEFQKIVAN